MGRKTGGVRLNVFFEEHHVGTLERSSAGALSFTYSEQWLNYPDAFPVSHSLRLQEDSYHGNAAVAYFDNLLPDNDTIRKALAGQTGAASTQSIDLLSALGRDCVGALQFYPASIEPEFKLSIEAIELREHDIAERLRHLAQTPLGVTRAEDFRISIAGAQAKSALLSYQGKWHLPLHATPTSHIIKVPLGLLPNGIDLSTSVENEYLCLKLCEHFGLPVASSSIAQFEDVTCLVVERFDRHWLPGLDQLKRLPQEDMCQALGVTPSHKYQTDGGPGIARIMNFLDASDARNADRKLFFKAQLVFFLLGAPDGHAKNFSIFIRPGGFGLTPLYDILSLAPALRRRQVEHKHLRLAMCVGDKNHYRLDEIRFRHWEQTAKQAGFSTRFLEELIVELLSEIQSAEKIIESLPEGFPKCLAEASFDFMRRQAGRLRQG